MCTKYLHMLTSSAVASTACKSPLGRSWQPRSYTAAPPTLHSFAEIFAGNCEMLGMPAACAPADEVAKLQAAADADPRAEFRIDLDRMEIRGAGLGVSLEMPGNRRRALLEGHWDSTGVLVANAGKVREVCERLPYVRGYR